MKFTLSNIKSLFLIGFLFHVTIIVANIPPIIFSKKFFQNKNSFTVKTASPIILATGNQVYCPLSSIKIIIDLYIDNSVNNSITDLNIQISSGYIINEDTLTLTGSHPNLTTSWNTITGKLKISSITGAPLPNIIFINAAKDIEFKNSSPNSDGIRNFSINLDNSNYLPSTNHYYQFISSPGISWGNAKRAAELSTYYGLQGYLATITSLDEAKFVGEQLNGNGWIAGSDAQKEGEWKWESGPEKGTVFWFGYEPGFTTTFAYWTKYTQPDNGGAIQDFNTGFANYTYINNPEDGQKGRWNDLSLYGSEDPSNSDYPRGYIIEYGGMPRDPTPQIATSTSLTVLSITNTKASEVCNSGSSTLEATTSTGTINWYESEFGGTVIATGTKYSTPILNISKTYYVESVASGCTNKRIAVDVIVNPNPIVTPISTPTPTCGLGIFFLKATATDGVLNWYSSINDETILATGTTYITPQISSSTTIYVEANKNNCKSTTRTPFEIEIYPLPPVADQHIAICFPNTIELEALVPNMSYLWSTSETTQTITTSTTGIFTVDVTSPAPENCTNRKTITVAENNKPEIKNIIVNETTISIELVKNETYFEYSIDGVNFQSSNIFTNAPSGLQTAYVREINECSSDSKPFIVIIVPKYFTPNNDGYNDAWEVKGIENYPLASITLFDRYGKLIKKLDSFNSSWDGTLDKNPLPATDYWYILKLNENSPEKKGHFSLKR